MLRAGPCGHSLLVVGGVLKSNGVTQQALATSPRVHSEPGSGADLQIQFLFLGLQIAHGRSDV